MQAAPKVACHQLILATYLSWAAKEPRIQEEKTSRSLGLGKLYLFQRSHFTYAETDSGSRTPSQRATVATEVQGEVLQGLSAKEVSLFSWKTTQGEGWGVLWADRTPRWQAPCQEWALSIPLKGP